MYAEARRNIGKKLWLIGIDGGDITCNNADTSDFEANINDNVQLKPLRIKSGELSSTALYLVRAAADRQVYGIAELARK